MRSSDHFTPKDAFGTGHPRRSPEVIRRQDVRPDGRHRRHHTGRGETAQTLIPKICIEPTSRRERDPALGSLHVRGATDTPKGDSTRHQTTSNRVEMWYSTWYRSKARRQPVFFQQFTDRPAEAGMRLQSDGTFVCACAAAGSASSVVMATRIPHAAWAARHRRRTRRGFALLSLVSAVLALTPWRDGFLASICDEPRAGKNEPGFPVVLLYVVLMASVPNPFRVSGVTHSLGAIPSILSMVRLGLRSSSWVAVVMRRYCPTCGL